MFKKAKRVMAFLLTLVVVASLVYDGGYAPMLAQAASEGLEDAADTESDMSDAGDYVEPSADTGSESADYVDPSADSSSQSENGSEEPQEPSDQSNQNTEDPSAGDTPAAEEAPEATAAPEPTATQAPTETPTAAPTATPEPSATPTPAEAALVQQTLTPAAEGATITLKGMMPEGATATAVPANVEIAGQEVLAAYDITIRDAKGAEYQPQAGAIEVKIVNAAVQQAKAQDKELSVYHMETAQSQPVEITNVEVAPQSVTFAAESFSIYAITKDHYTVTYKFYDGNGSELVNNKQILSEDETLTEPQTPSDQEGRTFLGWYGKNSDGSWIEPSFTDFGTKKAWELAGESGGKLTKSYERSLFARYEMKYHVYYMAENTENSRVLYTQEYLESNAKIVTDNVPFVPLGNQALIGWTRTPGKNTPDGDLQLDGKDLNLYPVTAEATWIYFHANGGSSVAPQYVLANGTTKKPQDPSKVGYTFGGWFTDAEFKDEFAFGNSLSKTVELYAKWNPKNVNYTIVYWQENPNDDSYSFKGTEPGNGKAGEQTNVTPKNDQYSGFSLSRDEEHQVVQQTIAGDGSTVVNVYYDRNIYEIKFQEGGRRNWKDITELTITAKYGADISDFWPSKKSTQYPARWATKLNFWGNATEPYQSGLGTMPLGGTTFYKITESGKNTIRTEFYLQSIDGKTYELDHRDEFKDNQSTSWSTTENDYYDIKGFKVKLGGDSPTSDPIGSSAKRQWEDRNTYGWKFYYDRNEYTIEFHNGGTTEVSKAYKYEADISNAGYKPQTPPSGFEGYTFAGWYENEKGLGEVYSFVNKKMPANNLILYAKWVAPVYTVTFDLNGGQKPEGVDNGIYNAQTISKQGKATEPEQNPVREGYTFAGWYKEDGSLFNFQEGIEGDVKLVAKWIGSGSYHLYYESGVEGGSNLQQSNSETYVDGSKAKIQGIQDSWGWTPPSKTMGFAYWIDEKGEKYYPGDMYPMGSQNVTLTAHWAEMRETSLIYDYNGGKDEAGHSESDPVIIKMPNSDYQIEKDGTNLIRDGYEFIGWSDKKEGSEPLLQKGSTIHVDTMDKENNILYAQWKERVFKVTIQKNVEGNMGDTGMEFNFTYTIDYADETKKDLEGSFSLKDFATSGVGHEISELRKGDIITLTEEKSDGYTTIISVNGTEYTGTSHAIKIEKSDVKVIFTNEREVVPPTGLTDNMAPFTAMILAGLGAAVVFFRPRRRRRL